MSLKSIRDCERSQIEKLGSAQLPNSFKKLGLIIFIICFAGLFINRFSINLEDLRMISKYGLLIGLLMMSISKDKFEDERIAKIRMQSYTLAFIMGVFMTFLIPFADYLVDFFIKDNNPELKNTGDWQILWLLLSTQVLFFELLKRKN